MSELQQITNSMLWSVYGDALGFMSELVDESGLVQRTGKHTVDSLVEWKLRVGGRYGATVTVPAGMYSDDTQLRLATARCIDRNGNFDVDAFAKIELPVWLCYALGGGRGTKAAASNLSRDNIRWFANFYSSGDTRYVTSGGNGAAMRVQPHVWAASRSKDVRKIVLDVIRNTVTTHGHPRAIVGAVLYASVLSDTLLRSEVLGPKDWEASLSIVDTIPSYLSADDYLASMWLPEWERQTKSSFSASIADVVTECRASLARFSASDKGGESDYKSFVDAIGGRDPKSRGAGTTSVLATLALVWLFRSAPHEAIRIAVNFLGSDTDTIASMAGALLGAASDVAPSDVRDIQLFKDVASKMYSISRGEAVSEFGHPSLLTWRPPRTAIDAVGISAGQPALAGLGKLTFTDTVTTSSNEKTPSLWRWAVTEFGQSTLVKFRPEPQELEPQQLPNYPAPKAADVPNPQAQTTKPDREIQITMFKHSDNRPTAPTDVHASADDLDEYTQIVIRSNFDPRTIGELLVRVADQPNGIERAIGFAAIVAKARVRRARAAKG